MELAPTVLDRMLAAGVSEERARRDLAAGSVRLDGQVVTDAAASAPPPARIVLLLPG